MPDPVLIVAAVVAVVVLLLWIFGPRMLARVVTAALLLGLLLFCCFGFMATFEPMDRSVQLTWRVVYVVLAIGSLSGAVWLLLLSRARR